jgi:hypothetical protein
MFKPSFSNLTKGFNIDFSGYEVLKGEDGFSPEVEVTKTEFGYILNITDKDKTEVLEIGNGVNGKDGRDGEAGP